MQPLWENHYSPKWVGYIRRDCVAYIRVYTNNNVGITIIDHCLISNIPLKWDYYIFLNEALQSMLVY